jgi:hypothetical protein
MPAGNCTPQMADAVSLGEDNNLPFAKHGWRGLRRTTRTEKRL